MSAVGPDAPPVGAPSSGPGADPLRRLWGGRFGGSPAPELERLNRSLPVDRRLWREDIAGSLAWAVALRAAGVVTAEEEGELRAGLHRVAGRLEAWTEGEWSAAPDEDIHSLVERLLHEEAPGVAGKLHTGRSRNDQVATDARLWAMGAVDRLDAGIDALQRAFLEQAEDHLDTLMPGYTHVQRAQPISAAHWLLSHFWPLDRDRERLADACRRAAVLPLGSGAVAGCPFPVDRVLLQEVLGLRGLTANSVDAVADRDWVAELLFVMSLVGVHLSRLAEDLVLFGSAEFGFVRFSDQYSTGSSLMPQKRNPDAMELARAKAGRLLGELVGFLTVLKGLPSGYNKDLQEDKQALFQAFDTLDALLPAVAGTVRTLTLDRSRCAAAIDAAMFATDLADVLVRAGMPFRQAHEQVGRVVRLAEESGGSIDRVSADALAALGWSADIPLDDVFDAARSVERRAAAGGTAPAAVREQLALARARLG
ncbi:MAG TPA: argininosuccinate lyase [Longimicrobiales bacterium]|nr:argininosuccinate lyase [Longimicrobiales bacterium]